MLYGLKSIEVRLNPDVMPSGSDLAVVNAARRSFNSRSTLDENGKLRETDKRLLEFLARGMTAADFETFKLSLAYQGWRYENDDWHAIETLKDMLWKWRNTATHDTPFNHCFVSFDAKAPMFTRAHLVKHEYLVNSDISRRYMTEGLEFYHPNFWRMKAEDKKQGSLMEPVQEPLRESLFSRSTTFQSYKKMLDMTTTLYEDMLDNGTAPELARMVLPQSLMAEWTWSGSLGAFAKMCRERMAEDAQYESRVVANLVYRELTSHYPVSAPALVKGV